MCEDNKPRRREGARGKAEGQPHPRQQPRPLPGTLDGLGAALGARSQAGRPTSYSFRVPFQVQPSLGQTAGRLSTSLRAALSGKAWGERALR